MVAANGSAGGTAQRVNRLARPHLTGDLWLSLSRPSTWLYPAWVAFRAPYRKSLLGICWPVLSPLAFVAVLGSLFSAVMGRPAEEFIPSLTVGLIVWNYINSIFISASEQLFKNARLITQGYTIHTTLVLREIARHSLYLLFQSSVIAIVFAYFDLALTSEFLLFLLGLALLYAHSLWIMSVLSIITARYHDLRQLIPIIMRVGFLATPIVWMPSQERGEFLAPFLLLNPFFQVLEPIRAPLLGKLPDLTVYAVSSAMAVAGLTVAALCYRLFQRKAILWV